MLDAQGPNRRPTDGPTQGPTQGPTHRSAHRPTHLHAPQGWVAGRWQPNVLLGIGADGCWSEVSTGVAAVPDHCLQLHAPVLPGLVNAHSHAFQRAFAGLAERRESQADDFWSWRDRMYGVAQRVSPAGLRALATQLYVELLRGGYTQVCEFHYLHHQPDGRPYDEPATLMAVLTDAADDAGLGATLMPVLYERAGFAEATLRTDQRRFASTPALVEALCRTVQAWARAGRRHINAGIAIHSLRAASPSAIATLLERFSADDVPIHVHVAEQEREVQDCLAATGLRPIEWLCHHAQIDARWQLVHATHATPQEIDAVAARGAGIVICPSTEGNLGDGFADLPAWLQANVPMAIGSDSHVTRCWAEELRWLEYGQRLRLRQRNVAAAPQAGEPSTAARLFNAALAGGGRAAGQPRWGLEVGARADALVLDVRAPGLLGVPSAQQLDALVFATDAPAIDTVYVAGQRVISGGRHGDEDAIAARFAATMDALWQGA